MPYNTPSNKRIAKNTAYMYIRMLFTMIVSLYTSRVVLHTLGEEDFGTYGIVGGVVVLFTFISSAMATGTQRHLSYELGKPEGDVPTIFSACLIIHLWLACIIFVLAETIGLWFLNNKMNFPEGRMTIVNWIYQISILSCMIGIAQAPFTASIISYEKMSFYAFLSILDVLLKLSVVFLLILLPWDKLLLYAILLLVVHAIIFLVYALYSFVKLQGVKIVKITDKSLYKRLISFSGWSLFGSLANVGYQHGINIIINIFFGVTLNAAVGIANQINSAVSNFMYGFQQALNPQLVQSESSKDKKRQLDLIYKSSKFSFFIVFIIAFPLIVNLKFILYVWLGQYPAHTDTLSMLIIAGLIISCLSGPLWVTIYATGKIKYYQIVVSIVALSILPISYLAGKAGGSPEMIFVIRTSNFIFVLLIQLFFLHRYIELNVISFTKAVLIPVFMIMTITVVFHLFIYNYMQPAETIWSLIYQTAIYVLFIGMLIWIIGFSREERKKMFSLINSHMWISK